VATPTRRSAPDVDRADELWVAVAGAALNGDSTTARQLLSRLIRPSKGQRSLPPDVVQRLGGLMADFDREGPLRVEGRREPVRPRATQTPPPPLLKVTRPDDVDPVLREDLLGRLDQIIREHQRSSELRAHGLWPTTKVLLTGPPGVGKTLSAGYLARALGVPLAAVDPATVMSSLLGESARNLRDALAWCRRNRCVVLIDEFDAFAKRRDDVTDVGELKRLVNMLLLELDHWASDRLLVAATNHPQLLDPAVARRFDVALDLPLPDSSARAAIIERLLAHRNAPTSPEVVRLLARTTERSTGSDLSTLITNAVRASVLEETTVEAAIVGSITPPRGKSREATKARAAFCALAHDVTGYSNREIARVLGMSNASVSELVRAGRRDRD
jgi:ATPase family associated with various cellular activities (AAA)